MSAMVGILDTGDTYTAHVVITRGQPDASGGSER
jgi:hypothetical protein